MPVKLPSVTNVFFWAQLLLKGEKKTCTASLKRLLGMKLEGLEIEWTNRALSRYLWLNRATAGSYSLQNAALGCLRGAQTTAHPLSGLVLSRHDKAPHLSRALVGVYGADAHACDAGWVMEEAGGEIDWQMGRYITLSRMLKFTPPISFCSYFSCYIVNDSKWYWATLATGLSRHQVCLDKVR